MLNALTIDLEDWYQGLTSTGQQTDRWPTYQDRVVEDTDRLLDILDQAAAKATFFVLGYVADQFPGLVRRVADAGHEIGLHGYHHRQVFQFTPQEFRAEILKGRAAVEAAGGRRVIGYRAPIFSINGKTLWALEILRDLGFQYDSSVFATRNMLYGFPDAPRFPYHPFDDDGLIEFPLSTVRMLRVNWPAAGGFYLRLLPYPIFRTCIRHINREGHAAILYLHPWEIDPDQPRPDPTLRERFTHYYNLKRTAAKLEALLKDFRFGPLVSLLDQTPVGIGAIPRYRSQCVAVDDPPGDGCPDLTEGPAIAVQRGVVRRGG